MVRRKADHSALEQLRAVGLHDRDCGVLLLDLMPGAVQRRGEEKREIVIDGGEGRQAVIRFNNKGKIKEIVVPDEYMLRLAEIIGWVGRKSERKVVSTTLLGSRPLDRFYRVGDWVQLRPVDTEVLDQTMLPALPGIPNGQPHPFVLEVAYTATPELPAFEAHRRMVALDEAKLLVSAFLELPVHQNVPSYAWALTMEHRIALVRCTTPHMMNPPDRHFSDTSDLQPLSVTDDETYFTRLGVGVSTFEVPDMAALRRTYDGLSVDDRARFLRACANLWDSGDQTTDDGKRLVASIAAIEALLPEGEKCSMCGAHMGIAKRFRAFVRKFVPTTHARVLEVYNALYSSRSAIAHGSWHDSVDQPMFSLMMRDGFTERLAGWNAAKVGTIGWLRAGGNSTVWWDDHDTDHKD